MTTSRLTVALLLTALPLVFAGPVQAQSDDTSDDTDQHEVARPGAPKPLVDQTNHHHGNGGDDGAARPSLRPDPADVPGVREGQPTITGLAQTQAPLPGELADTPEARAPLFAKSPSDLAIRPDPWETPDK